jgi:hypothetical protein
MSMLERLNLLKTYAECEDFARLVQGSEPEIAVAARRKALDLRAREHGAETAIEMELLRAVYAYEEAATVKSGRRMPAARTWQMIKRSGIVRAAERAVTRAKETTGYSVLAEVGLSEFAFEAVIRTSLAEFDVLFASLQHRAFRGEL